MKKLFILEYNNLSSNEKIIIDYLNSDPVNFYLNDIDKISKSLYISTSTTSRLAKKLGYQSFKELQFYVYYNFLENQNGEKQDCDNEQRILYKTLNLYNHSINETFNNLDLENIKNIINKIQNSDKIIFYGLDSSFLAAKELSNNLFKLGFNCFASQDFYNTILSLCNLNEQSLLIIFSKTAKSKECLFLIQEAQKINIDCLLITANKKMKNTSSYIINYETIEQDHRMNSISSKVSQYFIADLIFNLIKEKSLSDDKYENYIEKLNNWNKFKA